VSITTNQIFDIQHASASKPIVYVLKIDGCPYIIGTGTINQRIYYGMPGLTYGLTFSGDPVVYGGVLPWPGLSGGAIDTTKQKPYLNLEKQGLVLSQKIEPWEGRSSVSVLDFNLADINEEMLALISPGQTLTEILLRRVELFIGYENLGYPDEFVRMYRGIISGVVHEPGLVTLKTSDPNLLRRQKLFETAKTTLTSAIDASVTSIPVISTGSFYEKIDQPGVASPELFHQVGIKIGEEMMRVTSQTATAFTVERGGFGSVAATHDDESEVTPVFSMSRNALNIALKLMLSGWGGVPSVTDVVVGRFVNTGDSANPSVANGIIFTVDVKDEYGLEVGDFVTISGATNGANNFTETPILSFFDVAGAPNRGMILSHDPVYATTLVDEVTTSAVAAFRSQFDVYPVECGLKMKMVDVDVARHVQLSSQFVTDEVATLSFVITEEEDSGKEFIEKELYLPLGGFSLTRQGKVSVVITAPPLPLDTIVTLDATNILDAEKAVLTRAINGRKFYNRVDFSYDYDAIEESFVKLEKFIDSDSLEQIPYKEYLQIESKGMRTALNAVALIDRVKRRLFERYAFAAQTITFKLDWQTGALVEGGDVVLLDDQGALNFPDLNTGQRGLPLQFWEVLEKSTDLKTAQTSVTIINGIGSQVTDRYGVIAPSSEISSGLSTTQFRLRTDSFGALFPGQEFKKWEDYIGLKVMVHKPDFSQESESVLTAIDASDQFKITVSPALSFTPASGDILQLANYSTSSDAADQKLSKLAHAFLGPVVDVASGASGLAFDVAAGDVAKFFVGGIVVVHDADYSVNVSEESAVTDITGTTITVETDLGFTPNNTQKVTFIGFSADSTQTYRFYG
jgi:hypothetical protein